MTTTVEIVTGTNVSFAPDQTPIVVLADDDVETISVGDVGPPGPPGPPGPMGTQGIPGNTILYGPTDPVPQQGIDGNFYINTTTHFMFGPKANHAWPPGTSLVGPQGIQGIQGIQGPVGPQGIQGIQGNTVLYGAADPVAATGIDGNFYINTTTHFMFGPKAAGAWPAGTSLVGPKGDQGIQGVQGPVGPVGPSGPIPEAPTDGKTYGRKNSAWTPVTVVVPGLIFGLTLSTAGGSALFGIDKGQASDSTNVAAMVLPAAFSKNGSAAWSLGSGGGALDTGAFAANTWYHVHLIERLDTGVVDVLVSLSPAAPTLPANYTVFRRIGSMRTNASSVWTAFTQWGDDFIWVSSFQELSVNAPPTSWVIRTLSGVPTGVSVMGFLFALAQDNETNGSEARGFVAPLEETTVGNFNYGVYSNAAVGLLSGGGFIRAKTNTLAQVHSISYSASANVLFRIETHGYSDPRGKW